MIYIYNTFKIQIIIKFIIFFIFFKNYIYYFKILLYNRQSYCFHIKETLEKGFLIMSQAKVDKYKKDKANRKKIIAKQKRTAALQKFAFAVVSLALVAFIVASAYFKWFKDDKTSNEPVTYALSAEEVSSVWTAYANAEEESSTDGSSSNETESTDSAEEETTSSN